MLERLFAPVQAIYRWLDDHPGLRLAGGLALFAAAILAPLPGWALDAWIVLALGGAAGMAGLVLVVGDELHPREALAGLPAFLRRFAFHRLALALALTKAVLLGTGMGLIMEWLAQRALGGSVGVGLAAIAAIYAARFAGAQFSHGERLDQAMGRLAAELEAVDRAVAAGRVSPTAAARRRQALAEEVETLGDGRQIHRLLRGDAAIGFLLAACLIGAGLVSGLVFKGWPWSLTLSQLTLYGLAEAILTATPGLVFGVTLGQWLNTALEEATDVVRDGEADPERAAPLVVLEVGRELAPAMRRAFPEVVAVVRTRLARELGLQLPRVDLAGAGNLPPRGYRVLVRGAAWARGEVSSAEAVDELGEILAEAGRLNAAALLTIDATRALLDGVAEDHPVAVAEALERHGLATIHATMQGLLHEQVPLRDPAALLEAMATDAAPGVPPANLVERLRRRLALPLTQAVADERGVVRALALGDEWEALLAAPGDEHLIARELAYACRELLGHAGMRPGHRAALVVPASLRPRTAALLHGLVPGLAVLAPDEVSSRCELRPIGTVERRAEIPWKAPLSLLKVAGS
jgi:flagellar biosynthesis component FlhA